MSDRVELPNIYVPPVIPLPGDLPILGLTRSVMVVDTETGGPVNLKKRGMANYWNDPETRTYMIGYKLLNAGPEDTDLFDWQTNNGWLPSDLEHAIRCPPEQCMLAAANVDFDRAALKERGFDTPHEKWLDVLTCAYYLGFAGGLDQVLKQTPLEISKDPEGTRLITQFSVKQTPWHEAPHQWERFKQYCRQDAHVEELLLRWCLRWLNTPEYAPVVRGLQRQEIRYRKINSRGIPVDRAAVRGALKLRNAEIARLLDEMREITGLDNPNSRDQLLEWLQANGDCRIEDLRKDTIRDALDGAYGPLSPKVVRVMRLRQETGKTSTKKFDALEQATSPDDRLRNGWRFYGASRTGRVGGRILNPANLARPAIKYPDLVAEWLAVDPMTVPQAFPEKAPLDTLSSTIRACLKAPEGRRWAVADLTSIESVGAAWLAGCKKIMDIFYEGKDTYKTFAAAAEGIDYETVTKEQRTLYKPSTLGGAYQLSGPGLVAYAASMGVDMNEAHANAQITAFREEYHEIVHYWKQLKNAAIRAVKEPGTVQSAYAVAESHNPWGDKWNYIYAPWPRIDYTFDGTFLICTPPSGRSLFYYKPRVDDAHEISMRDGSTFTTQALLYWGVDQKATGNFWQEISTHGGKLLENCLADCKVITPNGLVLLSQLSTDDRVWDGVEFVAHEGVVFKGRQRTIEAHGVKATPDHLFLTDRGWKNASESARYNRAACRLPYGYRIRWKQWEKVFMEGQMRLWKRNNARGYRTHQAEEPRHPVFMWLYAITKHLGVPHQARHVRAPSLRGLAFDDGPMPIADTPRLGPLRRTWDNGLRKMAEWFRRFLAGHGTDLPKRINPRASGQLERLLSRQLPMAYSSTTSEQQAQQSLHRDSSRSNDGGTGRPPLQDRSHYPAVPTQQRLPNRPPARSTECQEPVYDILNCGPRNRFVVLNKCEEAVIVHNCTQFICRDVLWNGLELVDDDPDLEVLGDVYDELLTLIKVGDVAAYKRLLGYMTARAPWMRDTPFFLAADGYIAPRYRKD